MGSLSSLILNWCHSPLLFSETDLARCWPCTALSGHNCVSLLATYLLGLSLSSFCSISHLPSQDSCWLPSFILCRSCYTRSLLNVLVNERSTPKRHSSPCLSGILSCSSKVNLQAGPVITLFLHAGTNSSPSGLIARPFLLSTSFNQDCCFCSLFMARVIFYLDLRSRLMILFLLKGT